MTEPVHATQMKRWLSTLRRRKQKSIPTVTQNTQRWSLDDFDPPAPPIDHVGQARQSQDQSEAWTSSSVILATIKSATVTIASVSIAPLSRYTSRSQKRRHRTSVLSGSDQRSSFDVKQIVQDEAAKQRSRKRRDKIEELLRTEESYIADVKALFDVSQTKSVLVYH